MKIFYGIIIALLAYSTYTVAKDIVNAKVHDIQIYSPQHLDSLPKKRLEEVIAILFHDESPESVKFVEQWNNVAQELRGIIVIASFQCSTFPQKCKKHNTTNLALPHVRVYPILPRPPFVLDINLPVATMVTQLTSLLTFQHTVLTPENIENFLSQNIRLGKILYYNPDSSQVDYNIGALSGKLKGRMMLGVFDNNTFEKISPRYFGNKKPTTRHLRVVKRGLPDAIYNPVGQDGWKYRNVFEFVNIHAETFAEGSGYSGGSPADATEERPWLFMDFPQMHEKSYDDICFKKSDQGLCVILLNNGPSVSDEHTNLVLEIKESFKSNVDGRGVSFRFMWMDIVKEKEYLNLFFGVEDVSKISLPSLVLINPHKRLRYVTLDSDKVATSETITKLLEKVSGGDARFTNIKQQKLPAFSKMDDKPSKDEL